MAFLFTQAINEIMRGTNNDFTIVKTWWWEYRSVCFKLLLSLPSFAFNAPIYPFWFANTTEPLTTPELKWHSMKECIPVSTLHRCVF